MKIVPISIKSTAFGIRVLIRGVAFGIRVLIRGGHCVILTASG
jgi:hypothetical protein